MMPSFYDIGYFLEVAETKKISRAAERLGIAQPSLTASIQRLEDAIGAQLLVRSKTGVQLTKAGVEFVKHGRSLVSDWQMLKANVAKNKDTLAGVYSLGCHPSVAMYSLPKVVCALLENYPELELKLSHDISRKITEQVVNYDLDFGIVVNPIRHPDLVILELATDEFTVWQASKPTVLQDVASPRCVWIYDPSLHQAQEIIQAQRKGKSVVQNILSSSSLEVIRELTAAGAGLGILPSRVSQMKGQKTLSKLPGAASVKDSICLVYRQDFQSRKVCTVLIDLLKKAL